MNFRNALLLIGSLSLFAVSAMAADGTDASVNQGGIAGLGAALCIAIAAFGGAMAQGRTATAALEGIARNPAAQPKIFTSMIIGLALIESLVIYALVIAFLKY